MRTLAILLCGVLSLAVPRTGYAQPGGYYGGPGYYNWGGGGTAASNYAYGMASVIQSAGQANLMNSMAAGNYEDAASKDLDNRLKYAQKYFETREVNREGRANELGKPLSSEQLFRIAHQSAPKPLVSTELDPVTGQIRWPIILTDPAYAQYRSTFEQVFQMRAINPGEFTAESYLKLQNAADQWVAALTARIAEYKSQDFINAKKFIESLAYEARRV